MKRYLFLIFVIFFVKQFFAQSPTIISVKPTFNEIVNTYNPEISVIFDMPMDSSTIDSISFSVYGERTGYHEGQINYFDLNKSTFTPYDQFSAGERITVTLSHKITSTTGDSLTGFIWTFRTPVTAKSNKFSDPIPLSGGGYAMQCIDMNNDKYPDIVTSSGLILLNDRSGKFPFVWSLNEIDEFLNILANDFNRDGYMDVLYSGNDGIKIGLGNGNGDFAISTKPFWFSYYVGADFNKDGFVDIAGFSGFAGNPDNSTLNWSIAFNDGLGNFEDTTSFKVAGGGNPTFMVPSDIDNDGDIDILISSIPIVDPNYTFPYGLDGIIICKNNGQGIFTQFEQYPAGSYHDIYSTKFLFASDFNNDGFTDIAAMTDFTGIVLLNSKNGIFNNDSLSTRFFWGAENAAPIATADFDGDKFVDIVISGYRFPPEMPVTYYAVAPNNSSYFHYFSNNDYFIDSLPTASILAVSAADVDRDDDVDIIHCGSGVYVTINKDTVTSIKHNFNQVKDFYIYQNYPNPFNNETVINFRINKSQKIQICVYNILGKEVKLLDSKLFLQGMYQIRWNGKDNYDRILPSGVYIIKASSLSSVKFIKTVLLK